MLTNIMATPCSTCYLCGGGGDLVYQCLQDHLFGAANTWNLRKCTNRTCGLIWLDPMPNKEDISKAYQTYYTHGNTVQPQTLWRRLTEAVRDGYFRRQLGYTRGVGPAWYQYLTPLAYLNPGGVASFEHTVGYLPYLGLHASVLDVGCGNGHLLTHLQAIGWHVEGVDFDAEAVKTAQAKGISVRLGDLNEQEYPSNYFDAVYMGHVIEHVYDAIALLRECFRVLKPNGWIIVLTPNTDSWGHQHFRQDWRGLEPPRHLYLYNHKNMRSTVESAGFADVEARTLARGARTILSMSAVIRHARVSGSSIETYNRRKRKLQGAMYQIWERMLLLTNPWRGEELLTFARKREA